MSFDLPAKIDKAIRWTAKQEIDGDPLTCLLSIPAYLVTAFRLTGKQAAKIGIVDQPDSFEHLQKKRLYGEREFLTLLAQERDAQGIPVLIPQFASLTTSCSRKPGNEQRSVWAL